MSLAYGGLAAILVLLGLLALPVALTFDVTWAAARTRGALAPAPSRVALTWAFGLVRVDLRAPSRGRSTRAEAQEAAPSAGARAGRRRPDVLAALRTPGFVARLTRYLRDVWHALRRDELRLVARLGLDDPAATGRLWGAIGPPAGWLMAVEDAEVVIEPDFLEECLTLAGHGRLRLVPLQLLGLSLMLVCSPAVWRGLRAMRRPVPAA